MNYALILAGGVGQRMRMSGMPKQFLNVFGKPIVVYTLETFSQCENVSRIVIVCNSSWLDYMQNLVDRFSIPKVAKILPGGKNRQGSFKNGIEGVLQLGGDDGDIVVIHDGVRPLVTERVINENIRVAQRYGSAMTVKPAIESVLITDDDVADFDDFQKRDATYILTSPQTFTLKNLKKTYACINNIKSDIPLLDAAISYSYLGNKIHMVKENNHNIKITFMKPLANLYGDDRALRKIIELAKRYPYESSEYIGAITAGLYGVGERMKKSEYEISIEVEFEGYKFQAPSSWDSYLTGLYGDYMKLPPMEKRIAHTMEVYKI